MNYPDGDAKSGSSLMEPVPSSMPNESSVTKGKKGGNTPRRAHRIQSGIA